MPFSFIIRRPDGATKLISAHTLEEIKRLKHNYKSSKVFRGCQISQIMDVRNPQNPTMTLGFMADIKVKKC